MDFEPDIVQRLVSSHIGTSTRFQARLASDVQHLGLDRFRAVFNSLAISWFM
jgi:hypothetical protein